MNRRLQQWILGREVFAGVACVQEGDALCYRVCLLKKEKDGATLVAQHERLDSIEALQTAVGPEVPICLGVNVKGMLNRLLDYAPSTEEEALEAVLASASVDDFFVQHWATPRGALLSVVRRDKLLGLLEALLAADLWLVNVFVGPFWVQDLLPYLPAEVSTVQVGPQLLQLEGGHIVGLQKGQKAERPLFALGDEQLPESLLLAAAMGLLSVAQPEREGIAVAPVAQRRADFLYKKLFHYTAIGLLAFFFVALLANYLLFDHYQQQQTALELEVAQQKNLLDRRDELARAYADKKAFLGDQLSLGTSKTAYYADQLAATLPSTLQLTRLVLFPAVAEEGYEDAEALPRYDTRKIVVEGRCQASVFYNNWKRAIEELDWVDHLHNLQYQNDADGQGLFQLEITLADEH